MTARTPSLALILCLCRVTALSAREPVPVSSRLASPCRRRTAAPSAYQGPGGPALASALSAMNFPLGTRVIGPEDDAVAADFRPDRLNIEYGGDRADRASVSCY